MSLAALKRPFSARVLPGLLIVFIPILEFLGVGYKLECARTAMSQRYELPRWRSFKQLFIYGAGARFIQLIWLAPAIAAFVLIWSKIKTAAVVQSMAGLQQFLELRNLLIIFLVLVILAAIFAPACILNYVAEARFKAAFSLSVLRRMFSRAYLVNWLIAFAYTILIIVVFTGFLLFASGLMQSYALLITSVTFILELSVLWFPGITIWTLLGEAWGKSIYREYRT